MKNLITIKRALFALGLFLWVAANTAFAAQPDLAKAEALMKQGKAAEAYALLEPFEFAESGKLRYDYLLGIAALDSGKPDKATLAFERVLAVDPNFAGARIDMGRAYFQLGDLTRAKLEFETVITQNPPPAAKATIDKYLAAIEKLENAKKTNGTGYIEIGIGHDSNVNFATSQNQIAVPALGNLIFTLNPASVKTPDTYSGLSFGGDVTHQVAPKFGVFAGADVRARKNRLHDEFDSTSVDGRVGVALGQGADVVRLGLLSGWYDLDNARNRDSNGVSAEWRHMFSQTSQLSTFGQYVQYRFDPAISVNDFDQSTYGVNWLRLVNDGKGLLAATLLTGDERAPLRADGGKRFNGLRFGGQWKISEKVDLFGSIGAQFSEYELANAAFSSPTLAVTREDKQYDANLGINWHMDKDWTLRPQVAYLRNNSNIVIYQHDRTDVSLTVRRDFK